MLLTQTYFRVNIEGYAEVLGINGLVKIEVSETKFEFRVKGTMWPGIFDAGVHLIATYGNLNTMSFAVSLLVIIIIFIICIQFYWKATSVFKLLLLMMVLYFECIH